MRCQSHGAKGFVVVMLHRALRRRQLRLILDEHTWQLFVISRLILQILTHEVLAEWKTLGMDTEGTFGQRSKTGKALMKSLMPLSNVFRRLKATQMPR